MVVLVIVRALFARCLHFQRTVTTWLQEEGQDAQGGDDGEAIRLCDLSVFAVFAEAVSS